MGPMLVGSRRHCRSAACAVFALVSSLGASAWAQAAQPDPGEKAQTSTESSGAESSEATDKPAETSEPATGATDEEAGEAPKKDPAEQPVAVSGPPPDAAPPLSPEAQAPKSVALDDAPELPSRALELGFMAGIANRPSESDQITFGPAVAWGFYARPEIKPWLGVRLYYREEYIPVTVEQGGFNTSTTNFGDTSFDQPSLHLRSLGARAEPTWVVSPRLRLMAVIGIAWLRFVAPSPTSSGELDIETANRSAVELDYVGGLGAAFDIVPHWVSVGASFTYGIPSQRTGNAYSEVQAFDQDGKRHSLGPLPRFDGITDLLFSLGVVL